MSAKSAIAAIVARLVAGALALLASAATAAAQPAVVDIRSGLHPDKTRVVVEVTQPVAFDVFTLADPYRVVVDLPELVWQVGARDDLVRGLVGNLRYGLFRPGTSRIVLDLAAPASVAEAMFLPPAPGGAHRLVIDLKPTGRQQFMAALRPPTPPPADKQIPMSNGLRGRADGKRVVVLDAGHGGVDPGAIGIDGHYEKDLVLSYAQAIGAALSATGRYHVVLTRDRDVFLPLAQRVAIARRAQADLFISLHADSLGDRRVGGGAVYTLSETASDAEAAALAARENKSDLVAGIDLGVQDEEVASILIDLAQREAKNFAAEFAQVVVAEFQPVRPMRRRPHRFAGFRVLKAPDVPSVLLELGFMSNTEDARYLLSSAGRRTIVEAVVRAIDRYFEGQKG